MEWPRPIRSGLHAGSLMRLKYAVHEERQGTPLMTRITVQLHTNRHVYATHLQRENCPQNLMKENQVTYLSYIAADPQIHVQSTCT